MTIRRRRPFKSSDRRRSYIIHNTSYMKKLSIITINYNDLAGLRKTIQSVWNQSARAEIEHIVIDGDSTDGSAEYLQANSDKLNYWVSEKDSGIYNAMNKGIRLAHGDYIQILNAGDCLATNDVTARMLTALAEQSNSAPIDILYGNMLRVDTSGRVTAKSGAIIPSLRIFYGGTLNHDCAYIRRSLFDEYGLYDESLRIVSDWKWYLQTIGLGHVTPVYVDIDVTLFDCSGISETNLTLRNQERRRVLEEVLPPAVLYDYDHHAFDMDQMDRLRRHHLYPLVWFIERLCFKLEKLHSKIRNV